MILWTIRQMLSLRQAVLGRARPSELAWGLALGVAIGVVPKGNLVSIVLIGMLISLRVNHGMAALSAVACSFLAVWLDPWTHHLGALLLGADRVQSFLGRVWNWPLMPWTELNNTVVMGSTVAAGVAILPTYLATVPLFRWLAPRVDDAQSPDPSPADAAAATAETPTDTAAMAEPIAPLADIAEIAGERATSADVPEERAEHEDEIETQIDVIRLKTHTDSGSPAADLSELAAPGGQMNEALGYLLRRLRDSRQGKAA